MLVGADTSFRYAALSYVWGGYKQAKLNFDTYSIFHTPGSITKDSPNLSWTIRDAITVCRLLEERYLWVDCLCIQQDALALKLAQIERMDEVYGSALFIIVNAGRGKQLNANSPLAGVRPGTRSFNQISVRANDFSVLLNTCPRFQDDLELSKWRSRAWTFQEEFLSRALLIFTGSQCFLQAGKRLFCEDTIFETDQPGTALIPLTYNTTQSYHCKADADATGNFDLEDYCFIIESYVKRDITLDKDAIKAILGMLRRFSLKFDGRDSRLIFGHPAAAFDYSLCWTSDCFFTNSRRNWFPSWSWASRKQHVEFDLGHRYNKQNFLTGRGSLATSLYTDALCDGRFTLNQLLVEQTGIDILPVKSSDSAKQTYYRSHGLVTAALAERELHFSTSIMKLGISRYCSVAGEPLDATRTQHASGWGRFIVYIDQQGSPETQRTKQKEIGDIRLESAWRDRQPEKLYLDFIVIRATPGVEPFFSFEKSRSHVELSKKDLDSNHPDTSTEATPGSTSQTNTADIKSAKQEGPKSFPALEDPRLDEQTRECIAHADRKLDRKIKEAEEWRLSLMAIEWIDVPSGVDDKGKGKHKEQTRRVASRLDVLRFGPSVREWLEMGPTRVDVVLV
jgi:hypothetical protein